MAGPGGNVYQQQPQHAHNINWPSNYWDSIRDSRYINKINWVLSGATFLETQNIVGVRWGDKAIGCIWVRSWKICQ
jgi:hypothetical protein